MASFRNGSGTVWFAVPGRVRYDFKKVGYGYGINHSGSATLDTDRFPNVILHSTTHLKMHSSCGPGPPVLRSVLVRLSCGEARLTRTTVSIESRNRSLDSLRTDPSSWLRFECDCARLPPPAAVSAAAEKRQFSCSVVSPWASPRLGTRPPPATTIGGDRLDSAWDFPAAGNSSSDGDRRGLLLLPVDRFSSSSSSVKSWSRLSSSSSL